MRIIVVWASDIARRVVSERLRRATSRTGVTARRKLAGRHIQSPIHPCHFSVEIVSCEKKNSHEVFHETNARDGDRIVIYRRAR